MYPYRQLLPRASLLTAGLLVAACTPTVQVAMPNEPITINLNVKIEHEILVKVDKEIDSLLQENSNLF
ncbi:YnbE family lipoprotein [Marinobacterium rhizophilum]|uniref:YnbE family lipoprotein n=1 Tax=Marinobacterium rhizophilum TaxID=420402 RepID=A0ABY5HQ07_9GAMM|nr:YnbE family lipoprotein [Marinobacterium rhizophilum]UTW13882.1 YnbE family lipoprotein [Marinobacterium rhizophilum]